MTAVRPQEVRRQSIRVALTTTAIVAIVYFVVAVAVVAIVGRNLTAQIDASLGDALHRSLSQPFPGGGGGGGGGGGYFEPPNSNRPGGLPFLTWTVQSDGTVFAPPSNPALPAAYRRGHRIRRPRRSAGSTCGSPERPPATTTSSSPRTSTASARPSRR